jgi:uncharacterized protein YqhQ
MSANREPTPTEAPKRPYIGGQAVLEGVMMRSPTSFAVVVRRRDRSLHVRERSVPDGRQGLARLPLLRGVASLVESLRLGSEALRFSGELMERDLEAEEAEQAAATKAKASKSGSAASSLLGLLRTIGYTLFLLMTAADGDAQGNPSPTSSGTSSGSSSAEEKKGGKAGTWLMMVLMVGFLVALPQATAEGANKLLHLGLDRQSPAFQAMTGGFKLCIVVGYMLLIRRMYAIRRVFQYHGAEHKTISTYEASEELTVANARAKTTLHPRCGTTFLIMIVLVSVLVFTLVGGFLPKIETGKAVLDSAIFFVVKLPFLPVIAAVTFELQRFFARYCTTGPLRVLLWPGFLCQKITTIEPDDDQLEVALASLRVTLFREEGLEKGAGGERADVRYASFDAIMASPKLRRAAA